MIKHFGDLIGSIFFIVLHEMELIYLSLPTLSKSPLSLLSLLLNHRVGEVVQLEGKGQGELDYHK